MKKYIGLLVLILLLFASYSFPAVELDTDSDGYIDIGYMPLDQLWTFGAGVTISTGQAFKLGTTQWDNGSDAIDGEKIADDTIDDDSIDFTDVTISDFGITASIGTLNVLDDGLTTQILVGGGSGVTPVWGTDIPTAVTIGSAYIYRAGGTDVPVTDGGTGASTAAAARTNLGATKTVILKLDQGTALSAANKQICFALPIELNGMDLVTVGAHVYTASSSGAVTFMVNNATDTQDMLSTAITIDENETDSATAATAAVIDTGHDDVVTGDEICLDIDGVGTGSAGAELRLGFN